MPPWRRFVSWRGRIGRRAFFGGYIALCFLSGVVGAIGFSLLGLLSLADSIDALGFTLIAVCFIPLSALFAQRAHDIGWSALVPLVVFLTLGAPMLTLLDYAAGIFGHALARTVHAAGLDMERVMTFALFGNGAWMLFALYMMIKRGQAEENRFGSTPA